MIRLTPYVSGKVRFAGYEDQVVFLAKEIGLVGLIQNRSDGRILVIAEGEKKNDLERFASEIRIENALIRVDHLSTEYTEGTGQYSTFRKITGSEEVGERLDDGIEILKEIVGSLKNLTTITKEGFEKTLDKQDETVEEIRGLRVDLKSYMDRRFKRIEADLAELKEMKTALKEKGLI